MVSWTSGFHEPKRERDTMTSIRPWPKTSCRDAYPSVFDDTTDSIRESSDLMSDLLTLQAQKTFQTLSARPAPALRHDEQEQVRKNAGDVAIS